MHSSTADHNVGAGKSSKFLVAFLVHFAGANIWLVKGSSTTIYPVAAEWAAQHSKHSIKIRLIIEKISLHSTGKESYYVVLYDKYDWIIKFSVIKWTKASNLGQSSPTVA